MTTLNIRDLGEGRKAALTNEARLRGVSVANLVRQFIDEGIERTQADRMREAWLAEAREGLAYEAEHLARNGPMLARYRTARTGP